MQLVRREGGGDSALVEFDSLGRPVSLLSHGQHFLDAEAYRHDRSLAGVQTPMDLMMESVELQQKPRPEWAL